MLSILSPEARLLFLADRGPETDAAIREVVASGVNWTAVAQLAEREKAALVVHQRLRSAAADLVPAAMLERLSRIARIISFKMSYLEQRIGESIEALDRAGIPAVLLKGAALGSTVYDSLAERPMLDIDVLVRPEQARSAVEALVAAGWAWRPDRSLDASFDSHHHLPALFDARGMEVSLEVHTALFPPGHPFRLDGGDVMRHAVPFARGARHGYVPDTAHQLVHTSAHLAWSHMFRRGGWRVFRDVRRIIAAGSVDWDSVVALAIRTRARTCCYWTFRLAREMGDVPVPQEVLRALRPPLPELALRRLARHFALILLPSEFGCPSVRLRRSLWRWGIQPAWSGHGATRPWSLLALTEEGRKARGLDVEEPDDGPAGRRGRLWLRYCQGVLMGGAPAQAAR